MAARNPRLHLFDLPSEIRGEIWRHCVSTRCNRYDVGEGYAKYRLSLQLLRVCQAIRAEAAEAFRRFNVFCKIITPWNTTAEYVQINGRVPILATGSSAHGFSHVHLDVDLDVPEMAYALESNSYVVIASDDLPAFCRLWWYTELTHEVMNQHLRLQLTLRNPGPSAGREIPRTLQTSLLDPFTNVKRLAYVAVEGLVDSDVKSAFLERIREPYESPETCLENATKLKDRGNEALKANKPWDAVQLYEESFKAMFIIINGRARDEWGEAHFDKRLVTGEYRYQPGNLVRLMLRIELTANTIMAYYKLGDLELARFWGMRSIGIARARFGDSVDQPDMDFEAAMMWGRVYFGTSLACRDLGNTAEALELFQIARDKLPYESDVLREVTAFEQAEVTYPVGHAR